MIKSYIGPALLSFEGYIFKKCCRGRQILEKVLWGAGNLVVSRRMIDRCTRLIEIWKRQS